ncbi:YozE family protein [Listeria monocytogenes]|nr:YozE family protein [Listeria monocytogenes]
MTFYDFLITYYLSENSPLGDLAHDVQLDGNFPT